MFPLLPENPANWVEKFIVQKCAGGFAVYVETALYAELTLTYSVFQPDLWLATELVTGKSLGHHGRQQMKKARKVKPSFVDKGLRHFFRISGATNFALFWWMVYEEVQDSFIWWSSQIIETKIECPFLDYHTAYGDAPIWGSPFHVAGHQTPSWITKEGDIAPNFGPQGKVPPRFRFYTSFWLLLKPLIGHIGGGDGRVLFRRKDTDDVIGHGMVDVDPEHQQVYMQAHCSWNNPTPQTVLADCEVEFDAGGTGGTLVAHKGECWTTIGAPGVHHYPPSKN